MRSWLVVLLGVVAVLVPRADLPAQENTPLDIEAEAPTFALPGATAKGILPRDVSLADFKGKTVVLAFFYKARTKG